VVQKIKLLPVLNEIFFLDRYADAIVTLLQKPSNAELRPPPSLSFSTFVLTKMTSGGGVKNEKAFMTASLSNGNAARKKIDLPSAFRDLPTEIHH